jgi:serine/threonine protein kinase/tetratricopeptide (TPR) repeat protein
MPFQTTSLESAAAPVRIGPYQLLELIGEGGMGLVYRAQHVETGRSVALKTVSRNNAARLLALRLEIDAMRSMSHPGIVRIEDDGFDGQPWYAMELLRGETLATFNQSLTTEQFSPGNAWSTVTNNLDPTPQPMVDRAPRQAGPRPVLSPPALATIIALYRSLCGPLSYIHARGLVHRDLKPSNVFIRNSGDAVLMDFGLITYARGALGREVLPVGDRVLGSYPYLAPERIEGGRADARADLYALGCMLYETLCGRPPFTASGRQLLDLHLTARPLRPSELVDGLPPELEQLILVLLAKAPRDRARHAAEVGSSLDALLDEATRNAQSEMCSVSIPLFRSNVHGRSLAVRPLDEVLLRAKGGRGALAFIVGESGTGKTAIASEVMSRAITSGFRVVVGECSPLAGDIAGPNLTGSPLHPLRPLLQAIADHYQERGGSEHAHALAEEGQLLAAYEPRLASFADSGVGSDASSGARQDVALPAAAARERVLSALKAVLLAFVAQAPLLLVLDDAQWMDELSLSFLKTLKDQVFASHPLVVLCTCRTEAISSELGELMRADSTTSIELSGLDRSAVASMVSDMLAQSEASSELIEELHGQSKGNPYFVAEALRLLVSEGHLNRVGHGWSVTVAQARDALSAASGSLLALSTRRLSTLPEALQQLLSCAALLGRGFDLELLTQVVDRDVTVVRDLLRVALDRHTVEVAHDSGFRFTHDKLREAAYALIPVPQREALHGRAGAALEARLRRDPTVDAVLPQIARHYLIAGRTEKALEFLGAAANRAFAQAAYQDAIDLFSEGLKLAAQTGGLPVVTEARWERQIGESLQSRGEFAKSLPHLRRALLLLGQPDPAVSTTARSSSLLREVGRQFAKRVRGRRASALPEVRGQSVAKLEAARASDRMQQAYYYLGEVLPMLHACVKTLNLAELSGPSPELTVAYANAHAVAGILPGQKLVPTYRDLALASMQRTPDPVADSYFLMLSGVFLTGIGNFREADAALQRALDIAEQLKFARRVGEIAGALGILSFLQGEYARAERYAAHQRDSSSPHDHQTRSWAALIQAQSLLARGEVAEARSFALIAQAFESRVGPPERVWLNGLLGQIQWLLGDHAAAAECSARALADMLVTPPVTHHSIEPYRACAEVRLTLINDARRRGENTKSLLKAAQQAVRSMEKLAQMFPVARSRTLYIEGLAHYVLSDNRRAALSCLRESSACADQLGLPLEATRACLASEAVSGVPLREPEANGVRSTLLKLGVPLVSARPLFLARS